MSHGPAFGATHLARTVVALAFVLATAFLAAASIGAAPAGAQEFDVTEGVVADSVFDAAIKAPVRYQTDYSHDQIRGTWSQTLDYSRSFQKFAVSMSGGSSTSEDIDVSGSRSTAGNLAGHVDFRAARHLIFSTDGRFDMSSIVNGSRSSTTEQRRSTLGFLGQYNRPVGTNGRFTLVGKTEFLRNYDLQNVFRTFAARDTLNPDTLGAQRDSTYSSGRRDGAQTQLLFSVIPGLFFDGKAYGSRATPVTKIQTLRTKTPADGTPRIDSLETQSIELPTENGILDGTLTLTRVKRVTAALSGKRSAIDQVYYDPGQLSIEHFTNDGSTYNLKVDTAIAPGVTVNANGTTSRSDREYAVRSSSNALVTVREGTLGANYNTPRTTTFASMTVNRTKTEKQATLNGITLSRVLTANVLHRLIGRLWIAGLGTATLYQYEYDFDRNADPERTYSKDDRDVSSSFGSLGARFGITPRCSTMVTYSISRVHNVSIDETRSAGNFATTVYQINGALRMPLNRKLSIGQDYILTATDRDYDFDDDRDFLSRNFRIDTSVADTLFPFAFLRLDHRYQFFDQGAYSPVEPGGSRLYAPSLEQPQQTLEATVGIRPAPGVTLVVKQTMTETQNKDLVNSRQTDTDQWGLNFGIDVNRSFWNGAGLTGSVRREETYQNRSNTTIPDSRKQRWIAGLSFMKEF